MSTSELYEEDPFAIPSGTEQQGQSKGGSGSNSNNSGGLSHRGAAIATTQSSSKLLLSARSPPNANHTQSSNGQPHGHNNFSESALLLYDVFHFCRKRLDESSLSDLLKVIPLDEERESVDAIDAQLMAEYLKQIVNYLVKQKVRFMHKLQQVIKPDEEYMNEYEAMLQSLEAQCRTHIRIEQQLKICAETAQEQLEFSQRDLDLAYKANGLLEKQNSSLTRSNDELAALNKQRDLCIETLTNRIKELEESVAVVTGSPTLADKPIFNQQHSQPSQQMYSSGVSAKTTTTTTTTMKLPLANGSVKLSTRESIDASTVALNAAGAIAAEKTIRLAAVVDDSNSSKYLKRTQRSVSSMGPQHDPASQQQHQQLLTSRDITRSSQSNISEHQQSQQQMRLSVLNNESSLQPTHNHHSSHQPHHHHSQNLPVHQHIMKQQSTNIISNNGSNTYSQDALAYLLNSGTSNANTSNTSIQKQQIGSIKQKERKTIENNKYLFDKGEAINGKSNTSRGGGGNSSSGKIPTSSTSSYAAGQTSSAMKQAQSQAVLNRIQSKINGIQHQQSSMQQQSGQLSSRLEHNNNNSSSSASLSSNSAGLGSTQTQKSLTRSKSRQKLKENPSQELSKTGSREYGNQNHQPQQQYIQHSSHQKAIATYSNGNNNTNNNGSSMSNQNPGTYRESPMKYKVDNTRSQSVDAFSKTNSSNRANPLQK